MCHIDRRWLIIIPAVLVLMVNPLASESGAQIEGSLRWYFADTAGTEQCILDEILWYETETASGLEHGSQTNRITLSPRQRMALIPRVEVFLDEDFSLVLKGLLFFGEQSEMGRFAAPKSEDNTQYQNEVHLWEGDHHLSDRRNFSVINEQHPSGFSPIDWRGRVGIDLLKFDILTPVFQLAGGRLRSMVGVTMGVWGESLSREIWMQAYMAEADYDGKVEDYQNDIYLGTWKRVATIFSGPAVSLAARPVSTERLDLNLNLGIGIGWAQSTVEGMFREVGDIAYTDPETGERMAEVLDDTLPFAKERAALLPVIEGQAEINYRLWGPLTAGIGGYYSRYENIPGLPKFSYREGTWRRLEGSRSLYGATFKVGFDF